MTPELLTYCTHPFWSPIGIGAFMYLVYGGCHLVIWWRDREPGLLWLGLSALGGGSFYLSEAMGWIRPPGVHFGPIWVALIIEVSVILWAIGLQTYLDPRRWWLRPTLWLVISPQALMMGLHALDIPVLLMVGNGVFTLSFLLMGFVVWRARRREPGAGHELIALALFSLPGSVLVMSLLQVEPRFLRYMGIPSLLFFHTMVLAVGMHRRHLRLEAEVGRRRDAERSLAAANQSLSESNASLERKVAERTADLRDMVAGLEGFTQNVSHDLRGPLGGIEGLAHIAREALAESRTVDADRMLKTIANQARGSYELLASLLDLARVGNAPVHPAPVPLPALAAEVVDALRLQAGTQPLPEIHVAELPVVTADRGLLQAALNSLLSNACKFTRGRHGARVELGARRDGAGWAVYVRDNGTGFDPAAAQALFEPFQRLHGPEFGGHGVGLSIARRAIERQGGRVWAEAAPEKGACFWFSLPAAAA